ncbi:MAG: 16S rRNA (adenine(1518)-N(6)/adenine(1519)-N(6))-dimethyltransferase RsmA [Gammaproteobacteria bacterium]|nr:MAG: 16S rRNA (adenine(1518)-N(6)/adenine(1519)-N(6))-dimethyltransferase RsmA [Gammaproteobacteria bacterium]
MHPKKRLGQHFLHDPQAIARILSALHPRRGEPVVEIGPGQGALTCPLLEAVGELHAVEKDRDLIPVLLARCGEKGQLHLHLANALTFDFAALAPAPHTLRVVGNLPYNISTPLLFHLLDQIDAIRDMHFMLQKEVVDRLAASPNTSSYGRLTLMVQAFCRVERLFNLKPGAFSPPPRVASSFVRLTPLPHPAVDERDFPCFRRLVNQAFSQRRKTLANALRGLLPASLLEAYGISPRCRPETLGIEDFARLAHALCKNAGGCDNAPV